MQDAWGAMTEYATRSGGYVEPLADLADEMDASAVNQFADIHFEVWRDKHRVTPWQRARGQACQFQEEVSS